jgi:hypothetical protein
MIGFSADISIDVGFGAGRSRVCGCCLRSFNPAASNPPNKVLEPEQSLDDCV